MLKELIEKRKALDEKSKALNDYMNSSKNAAGEYDPSGKLGMSPIKFAETVRSMNKELDDIGIEVESLAVVEQAEASLKARSQKRTPGSADPGQHPTDGGVQPQNQKSFGQLFMESEAYAERKQMRSATLPISLAEMKTLFERGAGWAAESLRTGRVVEIATRPPQIIDLLPMETTGFASVKYMEETTLTNNAVEKAEGAAFGEAAFALTERSVTVEKLPVFVPVSDEQLEDEPRVQAYLDNRLRFCLNQRLDGQILSGNGSTPNLLGILNKAGLLTQAKGTDPVPDAIMKAFTQCRVTGRALPNAAIMHPTDSQNLYLLRDAMGNYIWGNPASTTITRIWGRPIVECDSGSAGTSVVGDFANFSALVSRRGIDVQIGYINDDFQKGRKSVRADLRCAVIWYRAAAFCSVTGL